MIHRGVRVQTHSDVMLREKITYKKTTRARLCGRGLRKKKSSGSCACNAVLADASVIGVSIAEHIATTHARDAQVIRACG